MRVTLLLLAILLSPVARAGAVSADHEVFEFLGWNKQCSVAFARYVYPRIGEAIAEDPIETRVGKLTIDPGKQEPYQDLALSLEGVNSWRPDADPKARAELKNEGYGLAGYLETISTAPVSPERDLPRLILSTDTYQSPAAKWLAPPWRAARVYYSPFASECALMLYQLGTKPFYKTVLFRIGEPTIRADRALAHVTNGLLLFESGDIADAVEEERVAAQMAPEFAPARYHHAAMLSLNGSVEPAIAELAAAIKLDPKYRAQARGDQDFDSLREDPKFVALTQ